MFENPLTALSAIGWHAWLALVWYGPFVTGLAFMFWYAGIQRTDAATAAGFSGMMPFTAFLLSVAILNEQAGWRQWAGCIMVVIGMALIGGFRYRRSFHRSKKAMMSLHKCRKRAPKTP
ncbi:DMT family transporter [Paenibacillus thailandensis]|uniref:DMT family transporter n=1 Tax=Paenibacillus thailandensis TaxID=393250 RepID=A0ABW5QSC3_9BACL